MFDHLGFYTAGDMKASGAFYAAVLGAIGYQRVEDHTQPNGDGWLVFGTGAPQAPFFVIAKGKPDRWRAPQQPGHSPIHSAFRAPSKEAVDEFHRIGLANGGKDNGAPGVRRAPYYCCFLLDADGNNIEAGVYLS